MRRVIAGIGLLLVLVTLGAFAQAGHHADLASATLYIDTDTGHGSGVHIGRGYVLTAYHVIDGETNLIAIDTKGAKHGLEVLWGNKAYDVAMLRVDDAKQLATRALSCRYLNQGEDVAFEGNPLREAYTITYGKIARSEIGPVAKATWPRANLVSGPILPGMSGGPVIDKHGYAVGINVGGFPGFDLNVIVPGRVICELMGR
jgi:S1-C subfamily serine protease